MRSRRTLVGLELFVGAGAVYGTWQLVTDSWHLSADMLDATPFRTWAWPGVFLFTIVALPMLAAALLEIRRSSWAFVVSLLAGLALMGWIVVQLVLIGYQMPLQVMMFVAGLAVAVLVWRVHPSGERDFYR
ncbi:MAG: hypothetical protein WAN48_05295 [Actinomycetes bacterium]